MSVAEDIVLRGYTTLDSERNVVFKTH